LVVGLLTNLTENNEQNRVKFREIGNQIRGDYTLTLIVDMSKLDPTSNSISFLIQKFTEQNLGPKTKNFIEKVSNR
jgi:hypothetical protein